MPYNKPFQRSKQKGTISFAQLPTSLLIKHVNPLSLVRYRTEYGPWSQESLQCVKLLRVSHYYIIFIKLYECLYNLPSKYICVYICIYVYICMCMCVFIYVYTYIYKFIISGSCDYVDKSENVKGELASCRPRRPNGVL